MSLLGHQRIVPGFALMVLALAGASLAGCISDEAPNPTFKATASGGTVYEGWGYAGGGTSLGNNSSLFIDVDEVLNEGLLRVEGEWSLPFAGFRTTQPFTLVQSEFVHDPDDFHSGGIAANFEEHGDSGVGDTNLPKMNLLLAGWGTGKFQINGTTVNDTYAGSDRWAFHIMVTDTGIRDDESGAISNSAGGPYDPAAPGDAVTSDDLEAILVVQSSYPNETRTPENGTLEGEIDNREDTGRSLDVAAPGATIHVVVDFGGDQGELGPYQVRLFGPDNAQLAQGAAGVTQAASGSVTSRIEISANSTLAGPHRIEIASTGVGGDFTGSYTVTYPAKPRFVLHFEDVEIEERVG